MTELVKITVSDEGNEYPDAKWCLIFSVDAHRNFCTMEVFGGGESACVYELKSVKRGGITCPFCLELIKRIKSIKL